MKKVWINFTDISDWDSFHREFKRVMGFPNSYGMNMDAWIDCMSQVDDPTAEMSEVKVGPDESLVLELVAFNLLKSKHADIAKKLLDCVDDVNERLSGHSQTRLEVVDVPILMSKDEVVLRLAEDTKECSEILSPQNTVGQLISPPRLEKFFEGTEVFMWIVFDANGYLILIDPDDREYCLAVLDSPVAGLSGTVIGHYGMSLRRTIEGL